MTTLVFFASIRETLDCETLNWPLSQSVSIGKLIEQITADKGETWAQVLCAPNTLVALNQALVDRDTLVSDGDEVAFFPPVTGG